MLKKITGTNINGKLFNFFLLLLLKKINKAKAVLILNKPYFDKI